MPSCLAVSFAALLLLVGGRATFSQGSSYQTEIAIPTPLWASPATTPFPRYFRPLKAVVVRHTRILDAASQSLTRLSTFAVSAPVKVLTFKFRGPDGMNKNPLDHPSPQPSAHATKPETYHIDERIAPALPFPWPCCALTTNGHLLSNSGSLAMFTAIRRASSRVIRCAADRRPGSSSK